MNKSKQDERTGVDDVRDVRHKIAEQYHGDVRRHAEETDRLVEPLIEQLGLKKVVADCSNQPQSGANN